MATPVWHAGVPHHIKTVVYFITLLNQRLRLHIKLAHLLMCTQADLHSFAVSADTSVVFYVSDKIRLIKWLVHDSDIDAETDLSYFLPVLTDKGKSVWW